MCGQCQIRQNISNCLSSIEHLACYETLENQTSVINEHAWRGSWANKALAITKILLTTIMNYKTVVYYYLLLIIIYYL